GKVYSPHTLQLVFEFVNLASDVKSDNVLGVDNDGDETILFLKNARKIARCISGVHASSLGLHPAVYFYGAAGRYQPTSFFEKVEYGRDFDSEAKSTAFLREALKNALRCQICQGFIHTKSISIDHLERKEDGGFGSPNNAQLTHPYCNTTYKN